MSAHRTERPISEQPDTEVSGAAGPVGEPERPALPADGDPTTVARTVDDHPSTEGDPAPPATVPVVPSPGDSDVDAANHERMEVSGTQVAASVLASVSAAVIASFFGVAGTIVGTAVVSVVATVGSAAYRLGINRTQRRLQRLQAVQALRSTRPLPLVTGRSRETSRDAVAESAAPASTPTMPSTSSRWPGWLAERRWGLAAGVAIVFVVSLGTVTLVEVVGDRPLAGESSSGRTTSLGSLITDDQGTDDDSGDAPEPSTDTPATTAPGDDATTTDGGLGDDGEVDGDGSSATTSVPDGTGDPGEPTDPSTSTTTSPTTPTTEPRDDPAVVDPAPTTAPPEVGSAPPGL